MRHLKSHLQIHHIRTKVILSVLGGGLLLLLCVNYIMNSTLRDLEREQTASRLESDIHYISDLIGGGQWSSRDGALYLGDKLIGDGTEENANLSPFLTCERNTGTFSYTFVRCPDKGLGWVGDQKTGYQQGHYMRVAGSTRGPSGESIIGTYIDKKVADILDKNGIYAGEANVAGGKIYCLYRVLRNPDHEIVGIIVVGRSIQEMRNQITQANRKTFWVIVLALLLVCAGLSYVISRWIGSIEKINSYLARIGEGDFPDTPLELNSVDEMSQVADSVNRMTVSLKEKERIGAELDLASKIQVNMLPRIFPAFPEHDEFDIYASMTPAKEIGGDLYDMFMLDEKRVAVVIADVSGKGVPAALFMVIAKTLIKNQALSDIPPCEVFTRVNEMLCEGNEMGLFVTAWMAILDLETGLLTYVNAGHNPPLLQHDGQFAFVKSRPAFVLGSFETMRYRQNELQLCPGDKLFLYTDGVTEAANEQQQFYGEARLKDFLNRHGNASPEAVLHALSDDIHSFAGSAEQADDITMLMLDYKKKGESDNMNEKRFPASDASLPDVLSFVEEELEKAGSTPKAAMQISVAVEEIFVNIAHYAYTGVPQDMTLGISAENGVATLRFSDHGMPFDPLQKKDPDITQSAENRQIGGLGIFMVKKTMDSVSYERKNGQNILMLTKKIN